jgi:kynurenine formamidase
MSHGFYNGVADESHGIQHWARKGIVGRAVLADVERWRASQGRPLHPDVSDPISPEDLMSTLEAERVVVEPGDVLLIRTGWMSWYRSLGAAERAALAEAAPMPTVGLRPGEAMIRTLWDMHVAAVAADNPALEVWPPGATLTPERAKELRSDPDLAAEYFMHYSLLPLLGLPIGELFDLDGLAADCAIDGRYACLFTSAPLNLEAGVASPPNALAVK